MSESKPFDGVAPFGDDDTINVVVETPAGSRCKFKYDEELRLFTVAKILPAGFVFPFDFGFVPGTRAEDGDPIDVMLIAEAGTAQGCLVPAQVVGALQAEQTPKDGGSTRRNDRILAVPVFSRQYGELPGAEQLPGSLREELEHFLSAYGALDGKQLRITSFAGAKTATRLIREAMPGRHRKRA